MAKYDIELAKGLHGHDVHVICEDCGWHTIVYVENGRGNLRQLKAEHNRDCYPPPGAGAWVAPSTFSYGYESAPGDL